MLALDTRQSRAPAKAELSVKESAYQDAKVKEESWKDGGSAKRKVDAAVMTLGTILVGGNAGEIATSALSPELNAKIHEYTSDNKTVNLLAHAALSALEAGISGNNVLAGVAGEASAMLLSETVFNKPANELTQEERDLLKVAGQLSGALAGNAVGNNTASTIQGMETAKRALENNYLSAQEAERKRILEDKLHRGVITSEEITELGAINEKDRQSDIALISACERNRLSMECHVERQKLERDKFSYSNSQYTPTGYNYPTYTRYSEMYSDEYDKVASFSDRYDVLKNAKVKADAEFYKKTGIDPSWIGRVDVANHVIASIAGTKLSTTQADKATQSVPKGVSSNEKLPVVGNISGYEINKVDFSKLGIEISKQNKHLMHTNEYKVAVANGQQKSICRIWTADWKN
ncbi:VENN motif pre-toxin domain-containing protein [Actinobacillus vicugnae]|uniref:VENN motif pre-toxin domain-containing protein n=1 Tax=Actinobacillus vicugnae TaxID=2573093 RepID=UPI0012428810|nr:VENN motif pre-toxin domain-containing protein [Actinobacillus vicugnae]